MGGSSKSSTSSTVNTSTVNTSLQGEGNISGDGNVIHAADAEVLKHLGSEAFGSVNNIAGGLIQMAADTSKNSLSLIDNYTTRDQLGVSGDALKWAVIGAVGVAGFVVLRGSK